MAPSTRDPSGDHTKRPVDLAEESVAGEEDPGASIELTVPQAAAGSPCPHCRGSGRHGTLVCAVCQGTGKSAAA